MYLFPLDSVQKIMRSRRHQTHFCIRILFHQVAITSLCISSPRLGQSGGDFIGSYSNSVLPGTYNSTVHVFPLDSNAEVMNWKGGEGNKLIHSVAWAQTKDHVAVAVDTMIKVWDIRYKKYYVEKNRVVFYSIALVFSADHCVSSDDGKCHHCRSPKWTAGCLWWW